MSKTVWDSVRPALEARYDVAAPTLLGHRGGPPRPTSRVQVRDVVDQVERTLDQRGLERVHVAGNSLGGWVAIELARRGRARTVCALSPAGCWTAGTAEQTTGVRKIRRAHRMARVGRPRSLFMRAAIVRRLALRDVAAHGDRLTSTQAIGATLDLLACEILDDILGTDEELSPIGTPPCPITFAWSENDAIVPVAINGAIARQRIPQAAFVVLPGVGHVPMIDDPGAVARVILESAGTIEIRDAIVDDFESMSTVFRLASLSNDADRSNLLANPTYLELSDAAVRPGRSVVAVIGNRVIGFASVDPIEDGLELEALFIDPEWMRRGGGTALVAAVVDRARRRGLARIAVNANTHALAFYEHNGFVEAGTVDLEFGPAPRMYLAL
jgi:pimeloyl-ACP methyl ester carboxylesterase/GNAT superfamily N-acetyltransferase